MQQPAKVAVQHAFRRGFQLVQDGRTRVLHALEGFRPPAGMGDICGQKLQLGLQVVRPGRARKDEGVIRDAEGLAVDFGTQHLFDVLGAQLIQAAFGKGGRGRPGRRGAIGRQVHQPMTHPRLNQDLAVAELGRLNGQPHAVFETHEHGVQVGDILALGHLTHGPQIVVGPVQRRLDRRRGHGRRLRLVQGLAHGAIAARYRIGRDDQGQRAGAAKGLPHRRIHLGRRQSLHGGVEQRQIFLRAGLDLGRIQRAEDVFGDRRRRAGGGALDGRFERGALRFDLLGQLFGRHAVLQRLADRGVFGLQGLQPFAPTGVGLDGGHPRRMELVLAVGARSDKWRIVGTHQPVQPAVQNAEAEGLDGRAPPLDLAVGAAVGRGDPFHLHDLLAARLNDHPRLRPANRRGADLRVDARGRGRRPVAEASLDLGLHGVRVEIADRDQNRARGAIEFAVKVRQQLMAGVLNHLDLADREPLGRAQPLQGEPQALLQHLIVGRIAQPLFG